MIYVLSIYATVPIFPFALCTLYICTMIFTMSGYLHPRAISRAAANFDIRMRNILHMHLCLQIWVMCKLRRVEMADGWSVKRVLTAGSHPVPGTPGHFFRGMCEAKSGEGAVLPVCVWECAGQLWRPPAN